MLAPLKVPCGVDAAWQITCRDESGAAVVFAGTETLAAVVWPGESRPTLFAPTVTFVVAANGTVQLAIAAAQTAAIEPGTYRLRATAASGGQTIPLFDGSLRLAASPGSAAAAPTYCTASDLMDLAPWLDRLQDDQADQEGFVDQRAEARRWFDTLLLRHYRGAGLSTLGPNGYSMNNWGNGRVRSGLSSDFLRSALAANQLLVRDEIVRCVASFAVSLVCQRQVGTKGGEQYWQLAGFYRRQAEQLALATVAEVDLDGDGKANVAISLGSTDTLYG